MSLSDDIKIEDELVEIIETPEDNKLRFLKELEFVQCLANYKYLDWLARQGYLNEPAFVGYLNYLLYWKEPDYSQFLTFPQCLAILDLLQEKTFRDSLHDPNFTTHLLGTQLFNHWKFLQSQTL